LIVSPNRQVRQDDSRWQWAHLVPRADWRVGAVHGISGLWVADASVMPAIPAASINLPTIVIAERIAQWLSAHDRLRSAYHRLGGPRLASVFG
jgi:hypothetical protein